MRRKSYSGESAKLVKTSVSLPEVLVRFAEGRCAEEGFNSFSAYLAHLVRLDKNREEEKQTEKSSSSDYPSHRPQASLAEDSAAEPKPKKSKAA